MTLKRANGTERALDLIETLSEANRALSRSALAAKAEMPRSTVYALCDLLLARGWLKEDADGQLLLGPQAGFVSNRYLHQHGFESLARLILTDLSQATGFLCEIDTVDQWEHVVALSAGRLGEGSLRPMEGTRLPLMPTAAARIILADMSPELLKRKVPAYHLVTASGEAQTWDEFFSEVRRGALRGFVSVEGWLEGTASTLACPVYAASGRVVASLCVILPGPKVEPYLANCLPALQTAADNLSSLVRRMGWPAAESGKERMCAG